MGERSLWGSHLYVEQCGSSPHGLIDLQAVYELRETWRALVVGGQHFDIHCSDGTSEESKGIEFIFLYYTNILLDSFKGLT